jgi:hypothetical protein
MMDSLGTAFQQFLFAPNLFKAFAKHRKVCPIVALSC